MRGSEGQEDGKSLGRLHFAVGLWLDLDIGGKRCMKGRTRMLFEGRLCARVSDSSMKLYVRVMEMS